MRLQTAPREPSEARRRRASFSPALRAALGTGLAAGVCVLLLLSPSFAVRTIHWSGVVEPLQPRLDEVERALIGRPLMLLSHGELEDLLRVDSGTLRLRFERHLPGTLEIVVLPRFAVWAHPQGPVYDAEGRRLDAGHQLPGLKRLAGFALDGETGQLRPEDVQLLRRLLQMEKSTGLILAGVEHRGADVVLTLQASQQRIWLRAERLEAGLEKLRLLGQRLEVESLPGTVDLRFRNQIVLAARDGEARRGR